MNVFKKFTLLFLMMGVPFGVVHAEAISTQCDTSVKFTVFDNEDGDKTYKMETNTATDENSGDMAAYATVSTYMLQQMDVLKQKTGQCAYLPQVKSFIKQNLSCQDIEVAQSINNNICDGSVAMKRADASLSCCVHRYNGPYNKILNCGLYIDRKKYEPLCQAWQGAQ